MSRFKGNVQDFATAAEFLGNKTDRKLAHNTTVCRCTAGIAEGSIAVWYHQTAIVRYYRDGTIRLDCGGWQTATTRERIRKLLPPGFYLDTEGADRCGRGGEWFISDHRPSHRNPDREAEFTDGMLFDTTAKGNPFEVSR